MKEIILICQPLIFFSKTDEKFFFRWIKKIKSIIKMRHVDDFLYIHIGSNDISDNDLNELIALFARYSFNSNQLKIFINEYNKDFFPRVDGVGTENYYKIYPQRNRDKTTKDEKSLKCTPLRFYTKNDENVMFGLIGKIKSVTKCYGIGQILYIVIDRTKILKEDIPNLRALFTRYRFNQKQLNKIK